MIQSVEFKVLSEQTARGRNRQLQQTESGKKFQTAEKLFHNESFGIDQT
jgi:hypothetical protein